MKTIMLIAGGKFQVALAKKIKDMGYNLVCTNLYPDSPAFKYADKSYVLNVLDKESNLKVAIENNISAVVSDESDISMDTVAYIAEKLNLATNGSKISKLCSDKIAMRHHCKKHNFFVPDFIECNSINDAKEFLMQNKTIIIKPSNSQASRGVHKIENLAQLNKLYYDSEKYIHDDGKVIAEEFMDGGFSDGREFTVDGIFLNGKHHTLAISKKRHFDYNKAIASEILFCNTDDYYGFDKLIRQNNKLMESTGAHMGLSHNEYKYHNGEFYLIELSNRGGGNAISSHIAPLISGVDSYYTYILQSLGQKPTELKYTYKQYKWVMLKFLDNRNFEFKNGKISNIEGINEIISHPNILDISVNYAIGDTVNNASNGANRFGYYISFSNDEDEIYAIDKFVNETLRIY